MEVNFAERLNKARELRGLSPAELADASNQSQANIHRYLKGKNKSPNINILVQIASALNVSTDYLLEITDSPNAVSSYNITTEEHLLLSAFKKASDRDAALVWQILEIYLSPHQRGLLSQSEDQNQKAGA